MILNIEYSKKKCHILDDYSIENTVPFEPSEYWYLDLYIITLDDFDGIFSSSKQKYMVLEYPSYTEVNFDNKINDCIWSVPYMAYLFHKTGIKRYKTIGAIAKFYEEEISSHKQLFEELENYRFYHMGISYYDKIEGRHYIEYKVSSRQPDKWKCYYIQEHYITRIDSLGILNLADPEGLHSYRYYPLIPKPNINEDIVYFAGKHLASNVGYLLKNSYNKLLQYSNPIPSEILRYQVYGIVFKIDVVGFTKMYNKIVSEMKSLNETGREIAIHFVAGISSIFENVMQEFGISQFVVEGDGLTGVYPIKGNNQDKDGIILLISCICKIKEKLNKLVSHLKEEICIRCSIIAGDYIYGKLAGLGSTKQASGEIMILLSRMDQYLQDYIKNQFNLSHNSIVLCIHSRLYDECKDYFAGSNFLELTTKEAYRETTINSTIIYKEV